MFVGKKDLEIIQSKCVHYVLAVCRCVYYYYNETKPNQIKPNQQTASTFVLETNKNGQQQLKQRKIVKRVTYFAKNQPIWPIESNPFQIWMCMCVCRPARIVPRYHCHPKMCLKVAIGRKCLLTYYNINSTNIFLWKCFRATIRELFNAENATAV